MHRLLFFLLIAVNGFSQNNDVLLLQKKHRTVGHYFIGSTIVFYTNDGIQVAGKIDSLKRDSIFMVHQSEWMLPNAFGTLAPVKGPEVYLKYAISDIVVLPVPQQKFNLFRSGYIFIVGGFSYLVLNVVNTIREKDAVFGSDNLPRVIGGLSSVGLGYLLKFTQRTNIRIGKKYQLKLLAVSDDDRQQTN